VSALALEALADAQAAAAAAASFIAAAARGAVAARGAFTLALSGGRTPARMLAALAGERGVPWQRVQVFQVDERVAPAGDAARNLNLLEEALLAGSLLARDQLRPMPVEDDDLDAAARRYAQALRDAAGDPPCLDLVHLGLGDDGHTASLVPSDPALGHDGEVCVTQPYRGHRRMTLAFPAIDRARCRLWLITGDDKGPMLARLVAGDGSIPAGRVARERSRVLCDRAAARAAGL